MKPKKVPEVVNLPEFADKKTKRRNGDRPLSLTKAERLERLNMKPGQVLLYNPGQAPEYKPSTHRKQTCPICGYSRKKLMAVCWKCNNCMACGSYCGDQQDQICRTCGNFDTAKPDPIPTIIV